MSFYLLQLIYFLLPAGLANMAPVLIRKYFKKLNYPLDFKKQLFKKRILGDHKTFRGLIFGIIFAIIIVLIQEYLFKNYNYFKELSLINYSTNYSIIVGFLMGFGALFGDIIKSFFKRQAGIKPGDVFMPFDQIDWIVGAVVFIMPIYLISLKDFFILLILYFIIHLITRGIGYLIGLTKKAL